MNYYIEKFESKVKFKFRVMTVMVKKLINWFFCVWICIDGITITSTPPFYFQNQSNNYMKFSLSWRMKNSKYYFGYYCHDTMEYFDNFGVVKQEILKEHNCKKKNL